MIKYSHIKIIGKVKVIGVSSEEDKFKEKKKNQRQTENSALKDKMKGYDFQTSEELDNMEEKHLSKQFQLVETYDHLS